jgi:hypothetical protein
VDQKVEDLRFARARKLGVWIVISQLGDPAQIGRLGAFTQSFELDKAGELLIPFEGGEALRLVCFFS